MKNFAYIAISFIFFAGCANLDKKEQSKTIKKKSELSVFKNAFSAFDKKDYTIAIKIFTTIRDNSDNIPLQEKSIIGLSMSLMAQKQFDTAMGVLQPFPEELFSEFDALKYALGGEILIRQNNFKDAESFLELALTYDLKNQHKGLVLFNLAKCYLENSKSSLAVDKFKKAKEIFKLNDDKKNIKILENIIKQLTPRSK